MDNPHCLGTVKGTIESLPGLISKELFINERGVITFDPEKITKEKIKEAIKNALEFLNEMKRFLSKNYNIYCD